MKNQYIEINQYIYTGTDEFTHTHTHTQTENAVFLTFRYKMALKEQMLQIKNNLFLSDLRRGDLPQRERERERWRKKKEEKGIRKNLITEGKKT